VNTPRRILLIDPLGEHHVDAALPLAKALERAGAQVRRIALPGQAEAVLDAIEQGWIPVALKPTAAAARIVSAASGGELPGPPVA
jgi:hypothetical protein